jgi:hypothetical protein
MTSENRRKHKHSGGRKTPSSAWRPGQSGNPGGRPKVAAEIRELARDHGPKPIERLVALMHSENEIVAVRAAEALLDRGYGRPIQGMELNEQEARPKHTAIQVTFVTPPKRDEEYPVVQHPSLIGLPERRNPVVRPLFHVEGEGRIFIANGVSGLERFAAFNG